VLFEKQLDKLLPLHSTPDFRPGWACL